MLDLPLALGAAAACGHLDGRWLAGTLFLGELGIDGRLHAVPGGLAAATPGPSSCSALVLDGIFHVEGDEDRPVFQATTRLGQADLADILQTVHSGIVLIESSQASDRLRYHAATAFFLFFLLRLGLLLFRRWLIGSLSLANRLQFSISLWRD